MCGIAGILQKEGVPVREDRLRRMADALAHRGPEGAGIWCHANVGFAHRRLALVDLHPSGAQPMQDPSGRYTITFNGEIYNYQALRTELANQGATFRSTSDTEVLLQLFAREGKAMLPRLRGMFAFAIHDRETGAVFFARDRIGKKPLYYREARGVFTFASELKALIQDAPASPDFEAVRLFLGLQYVPAPWTGFQGIRTLPPAHCAFLQNGTLTIESYDTFGTTPVFSGSREEAVREVRRLLEEAVQLRLIADVPVGAFLSGGVDSASVVALAAQSVSHLQTFTIGFADPRFDERAEAAALAKQFGTTHHAFLVTPEQILGIADTVIRHYDAPYADSSALPSWLLAQHTKKHVKAVLTGDGGDEAFAGYRRYRHFAQALAWKSIAGMAAPVARLGGAVLRDPRFGRMAETLSGIRRSTAEGYAALFQGSYFSAAEQAALCTPEFLAEITSTPTEFIVERYAEQEGVKGAWLFDRDSYLPDDLNVKMDRATMAHGLEARAPFLDQEVLRFVARLPASMVFDGHSVKPLLRDAMRGCVPDAVFSRPKRGFQVPLATWFRGPLREAFVARCLSASSPLARVCRKEGVQGYLARNDRGEDHGNRLWMLYALATWLTDLS